MAVEARHEDYGMLQHCIDTLFLHSKRASRLDLILEAEAADLNDELMEIVTILPAGSYTRHRMCTQLNSALSGHGWGMKYGTVE